MTKREVSEEIHRIIQAAVEKGGGDWRQSYAKHVGLVFIAMGKLTPEPTTKPQVPPYDESLVHRTRRLDFTDEQRSAARAVLRDLGLI